MQWHRHNYVETPLAEPLIIQRSLEPARHEMAEINLAPVLKAVNDLANNPAAAVSGDGRVEMNGAMSAIRAGKRAGNSAFKWFGARLAKRRDNTDGFCVALIAEMLAGSNICPADCAHRGIKERCDCS